MKPPHSYVFGKVLIEAFEVKDFRIDVEVYYCDRVIATIILNEEFPSRVIKVNTNDVFLFGDFVATFGENKSLEIYNFGYSHNNEVKSVDVITLIAKVS